MDELPEWSKPADLDILELLERTKLVRLDGMWLKPGNIAINIRSHATYVSERLGVLLENDMVEKNDTGFYRITEKGSGYIHYHQ